VVWCGLGLWGGWGLWGGFVCWGGLGWFVLVCGFVGVGVIVVGCVVVGGCCGFVGTPSLLSSAPTAIYPPPVRQAPRILLVVAAPRMPPPPPRPRPPLDSPAPSPTPHPRPSPAYTPSATLPSPDHPPCVGGFFDSFSFYLLLKMFIFWINDTICDEKDPANESYFPFVVIISLVWVRACFSCKSKEIAPVSFLKSWDIRNSSNPNSKIHLFMSYGIVISALLQ